MPFAGGLSAVPNATLLFSLAAAFLYAMMLARPVSWRRTVAKAGSVLLLAILAVVEGGPLLLVAALGLSALGDAFLAQDGERAFLGGLASFLLAHIAYAALFAASGDTAIPTAAPWRLALALGMIVFAAAMLLRLWPALPRDMKAPVAVYVGAILAMGLAALTVPAPLVVFGAVLFMASDGILAVERFLLDPTSPHRAWTGQAVWWLYYAAQLLITLGFLL